MDLKVGDVIIKHEDVSTNNVVITVIHKPSWIMIESCPIPREQIVDTELRLLERLKIEIKREKSKMI